MRRTPFRRARASTTPETEQEREQRLMDKARRAMNSVVPRAANMGSSTTAAAPIPKAAPVRSEAYRRAVASLPCINCKVPGYSQCAHSNSGKGAGIKASDLDSFPLCTVHPGADGGLVQGAMSDSTRALCSPRPCAVSWSRFGRQTPAERFRRWACGQRVCQYQTTEKRKPARWRASRSST